MRCGIRASTGQRTKRMHRSDMGTILSVLRGDPARTHAVGRTAILTGSRDRDRSRSSDAMVAENRRMTALRRCLLAPMVQVIGLQHRA